MDIRVRWLPGMKNWRPQAALASFLSALVFPVAAFPAISLPASVLSTSPLAGLANAQSATPEEAQALESQGKLPEAAEAWRTITQQHPDDAGAFASLGVVLSRLKKYPEAASAYREAIKLDPKLPGV